MLPCLNCHNPVDPQKAKIFAGVFVCETCHLVATRLEERGTAELRSLLTLQREAIRIALTRGELVLGPAEPTRELSKKEVLEQIVKLSEAADAVKARARAGAGDPVDQLVIVPPDGADVRDVGGAGGGGPLAGPMAVPGHRPA